MVRALDQVCQCFRWTGWRTTRWRPACSKSKTTSSLGTRPSALQSSESNMGGIVPKLSPCCPEVWEAWNCPKVVFMLSQSFQQSTLQSNEHNTGCLKMTKDADIINTQVLPSEDGPPAYRDSSLREGKALWLKNSNCKSLVLGEGGPQGMYSKVSSSLVIFNWHFPRAQSSNLMTQRSKSAGGLS